LSKCMLEQCTLAGLQKVQSYTARVTWGAVKFFLSNNQVWAFDTSYIRMARNFRHKKISHAKIVNIITSKRA
jgi:hypothetical protein